MISLGMGLSFLQQYWKHFCMVRLTLILNTHTDNFCQGFSLLMFGGITWIVISQQSTVRVNRKMLAAACALLFFSTVVRILKIS